METEDKKSTINPSNSTDVMNSILNELEVLKAKYFHDNADYDEWGMGKGITEAIKVIKKYHP